MVQGWAGEFAHVGLLCLRGAGWGRGGCPQDASAHKMVSAHKIFLPTRSLCSQEASAHKRPLPTIGPLPTRESLLTRGICPQESICSQEAFAHKRPLPTRGPLLTRGPLPTRSFCPQEASAHKRPDYPRDRLPTQVFTTHTDSYLLSNRYFLTNSELLIRRVSDYPYVPRLSSRMTKLSIYTHGQVNFYPYELRAAVHHSITDTVRPCRLY